jgi:hypothetical protein
MAVKLPPPSISIEPMISSPTKLRACAQKNAPLKAVGGILTRSRESKWKSWHEGAVQ